MEIWKPIPGFDRSCEASSRGRVRCAGLVLNQSWSGLYLQVYFAIGGAERMNPVHRLVALAFHPCANPYEMVVNHKDLDKSNNFSENLEWMTRRENTLHALRNGRHPSTRRGAAATASDARSPVSHDDWLPRVKEAASQGVIPVFGAL